MAERRTLVIGDVHGHVDRLRALLEQEGILDATGDRIDHDVRVVQVGDLGHYGRTGDADGDLTCWRQAERWLDDILWGNHDRAVVDSRHRFAGYVRPCDEIAETIRWLAKKGRLRLATSAHGVLLTHAGLSGFWAIPDEVDDAVVWLNQASGLPAVNAISRHRGGPHLHGGILWRDHSEDLSERWPQVYGHTRGDDVRSIDSSWCIDVGSADNGRLAGIWLPDEVIVGVYAEQRREGTAAS